MGKPSNNIRALIFNVLTLFGGLITAFSAYFMFKASFGAVNALFSHPDAYRDTAGLESLSPMLQILGTILMLVFGLIGKLRYSWILLIISGLAYVLSLFSGWFFVFMRGASFIWLLIYSSPGLITILLGLGARWEFIQTKKNQHG